MSESKKANVRTGLRRRLTGIVAAAGAAGLLAAGLVGAPPQASAAPEVAVPTAASPAAEVAWQTFPTVYNDMYWPQLRMRMEYTTLLTIDQTRMLWRSGVLPPLAGLDIDIASNFARGLIDDGHLREAVANNGCVLLGVNSTDKYAPGSDEPIAWAYQTYYGPKWAGTMCRV